MRIGYKRGSDILVPMFDSDLYDLLSPVGNELQIHEQIDQDKSIVQMLLDWLRLVTLLLSLTPRQDKLTQGFLR